MKTLLTAASISAFVMASAASAAVISFETDEPGFVSVPGGDNDGEEVGPFASGVNTTTFTLESDTFDFNLLPFGPPFTIDLNNETNIAFTQNNEGLGVDNLNPDGDIDIDGFGSNDIVIFRFSEAIALNRIIFEDIEGADDVTFVTSTGFGGAIEFDIQDLAFDDTDGDEGFVDFGGRKITAFGIGARGKYDSFRISRVEVNSVPLPAAGWMLLAGVGGMAAMRRRAKKKS